MNQVTIPGTELRSSSIALGGVPFGSKMSEEESYRLMDLYAELGGNMIDTAEVYANWLTKEKSVSETTIGKWMKLRGNRSGLIVTTKGAHPPLEDRYASRLSPEDIARDIEGSLRRLQVDVIDLYWLHRDDPRRDAAEILDSLVRHVQAGRIRYFGCSNWSADRIRQAREAAAAAGTQGFSANQPMWSLAEADPSKLDDPTLTVMDEPMRALHLEIGLAAVPYSSQAQGLFSKLSAGTLSFDEVKPLYRTEANRERLARVRRVAEARGVTAAQAALGYMLSQPFPTIPIVGCRTPEQLLECAGADGFRLTEAELAYLERGETRG